MNGIKLVGILVFTALLTLILHGYQAERSEHPVKESCEWMYQKARYWAMAAENNGNEVENGKIVKVNNFMDATRSAGASVAYAQLYMACQERNR